MSMEDQTHVYKIVLVGDAAVGKTHILNRYVKNKTPNSTVPTIGVEFATKTIRLKDGGQLKAQIWDTAGQEKYRSITSAHYRKAVGALLVYDITKEKSFNSMDKWIEEIKTNADEDIIMILVGNKLDIVEQNPAMRKVQTEDASAFAKKYNLLFEETSAFRQNDVADVFEKLLEEIYDFKSRQFMTSLCDQTVFNTENNQKSEDNQCQSNIEYIEQLKQTNKIRQKTTTTTLSKSKTEQKQSKNDECCSSN